jgi:hypothetical protein
LCLDSSSESFKVFKSVGVVLFADSKKDRGDLPKGAVEMLNSPKAGNTIPIVVVTSANGGKGIEAIPYADLKSDARGAARDLRKKLEGVDVVAGGGEAAADKKDDKKDTGADKQDSGAADEGDLLCEEREWTNSSGNKMRAAVVQVTGGTVTFKLPGGKIVDYPLERLSEDSRTEIGKLAK